LLSQYLERTGRNVVVASTIAEVTARLEEQVFLVIVLDLNVETHRPPSDVLRELRRDLQDGFGIQHTTIEFDPIDADRRDGSHLPL
jgi:CheY-like chemotaxis protein